MTRQTEPHSDPLIDEVRQRRRELFADFDYDLEKLCEAIQRRQAEHPEKVFDLRKSRRGPTVSPAPDPDDSVPDQ